MASSHSSASTVRTFAWAVIALGILAAGVHWYAIARNASLEGKPPAASILKGSAPAIGYVTLGMGIGGILTGLAMLIEKRADVSSRVHSSIDRVTEAVRELQAAVQSLPTSSAPSAPEVSDAPPPLPSTDTTRLMSRMVDLLEELRDTSLLNDPQKQARLQQHVERRRTAGIEQAQKLLGEARWTQAEQAVATMEKAFSSDVSVITLRSELTQKRNDAERATLANIRQKVEGLTAVSSWDEALSTMQSFMKTFPGSLEGKMLLDRLTRERELAVEGFAQHLYDQVKHESERRNWPRANAAARRLIDRHPDHPLAKKIAPQLPTLQENAEIMERKEMEGQIQQLMRSKRYADAIELGDQLVAKYPGSKQAETMAELRPRLEEAVAKEQAVTE